MNLPNHDGETRAPVGRPRNPAVDERVLTAAISVFGERGWSAFSVEAVAREAGVGKASIYLRWSNKSDLLFEALEKHMSTANLPETGDLRTDLLALASSLFELYMSPTGKAIFRMSTDGAAIPGVWERYLEFQQAQTLSARAIARRAIDEGRLPETTSVTMLLETLIGAVLLHTLSTPPELRGVVSERSREYLARLVDHVIDGASSPPSH